MRDFPIPDSDIRLIRQVYERFMPIDDEMLAVLLKYARPVTVTKGEHWLRMGETNDRLGLVTEGLLRNIQHIDGQEHTAGFSEAPYFVTEYVGFVTRTPARHSIVALEDSIVYEWTYDELQRMYAADPRGERLGRLIAEYVIGDTMRLMDSYKLKSAAERYADFVREHPSLVQRVPQYMLASFLGIAPESLSRIRAAR